MDISQYYELQGVEQGPPIVFIHGSYASTSTWRKIVGHWSGTHQCICVKLPGHCGLPDPPDFAAPTIETELNLLELIVQETAQKPVHLVGHSYGGVLALAFALKNSVKLDRLTLFEPVATWILELAGETKLLAKVDCFLAQYRHAVAVKAPKAGGQVIDFWCDSAEFSKIPLAIQDQLLLLQENNLRHWDICTKVSHTLDDLRGLTVPTRLVVGEKSVDVAHGIIDILHGLIPGSQKQIVKDANHLLVTTHSNACSAAM